MRAGLAACQGSSTPEHRQWRQRLIEVMETATLQGLLSRRQMCRLSGVPRSSLGRRPRLQSEWEISARQAMREVALECPAYGYRRVPRQWAMRREFEA